jgi:uncharacterized protein YrrD
VTRFVRAAELIGTPVATLDSATFIGEIRDVLFDPLRWRFLGFTLRGRGLLSPPLIGFLPSAAIKALGRDALMIASDADLVRDPTDITSALGEHEDAVGTEVLNDEGVKLGRVADLVLETDGRKVSVAGYVIRRDDGRELVVPLLPDSGPNWGEALVVPASVEGLGAGGLVGFREALDRTRALRSGVGL